MATLLLSHLLARSEPACAACHPRETTRYAASAMGGSLAAFTVPSGRIVSPRSEGTVTI